MNEEKSRTCDLCETMRLELGEDGVSKFQTNIPNCSMDSTFATRGNSEKQKVIVFIVKFNKYDYSERVKISSSSIEKFLKQYLRLINTLFKAIKRKVADPLRTITRDKFESNSYENIGHEIERELIMRRCSNRRGSVVFNVRSFACHRDTIESVQG